LERLFGRPSLDEEEIGKTQPERHTMSLPFDQLGLPGPLVTTLATRGLVETFPIQSATIPDVLAGRDVSGKAPTGSGKTLAFGLPLLATVGNANRQRPQALVLAPTRELAEQIKQELAPLARVVDRHIFAIYGGVGYGPQLNALRKGVDVLVATPGRLEDLIAQGAVDLDQVHIAVIDEADRMADMGFFPAVRRILDGTPRHRQTLLFSATLDGDIAVLSRDYQRDPVVHEVGTTEEEALDTEHHFWLVQHHDRVRHTADLIGVEGRSIVFTRTRHGADRLVKQLARIGVPTVALHGGRSQNQRTSALHAFSSGRVQALIATDVAARGIHIDAVASVIHFDPPADAKDYVHRSGRTARAGAAGTVVTLVTDVQRPSVRRILRELDLRAPIEAPRELGRRTTGTTSTGRPPTGVPLRPVVPPDDLESLYVANLPWRTTADDMRDLFGRFGDVRESTIITDRRTGRSRGFGFVDMPIPAAQDAIKALNGSTLDGRYLKVRTARPRSNHL
jgi:superfamily II DNA/RNA helicase